MMDVFGQESQLAGTSTNGDDANRSPRNKRRQLEPSCCPVCSVTLRSSEVECHLASEMDKLYKLSSNKTKHHIKNTPSGSTVNGSPEYAKSKPWDTYQKVRSNRHSRQRIKSRKRKPDEVVCPVCNKETSDDISLHVELCLRRSENTNVDSDENIDVEGDFEEYEWAGQSRVRTTSLLQGGVSSLGTALSMGEDDEDLVVDGDDTKLYGSPQYSERDVITPVQDKEQNALRKAVTGIESKNPSNSDAVNDETVVNIQGDPILEALKSRIRELESREQIKNEVYKCLICMERYHTPVISVCCWHVHCEQCWLQTLGAKKLCPQCNMITSPSDLRRIYM